MRKASKILTLLIAVLFIMSSILTGCGGSNTTNPESTVETDTSKPADLIMYLIGEPAKDYDMVLEEANIKLKEDLNASITVNWIGWSDFGTQYPLILASGEQVDLIYASTWTNYYSNAQKGAFMAIEDLAPVYAPKSYAEISDDFLTQSTVGGHLYGIPASFFQYGEMGYIVRGDLMKKYGMTSIDGIDGYGEYLDNVVKNDPQLDPTGSTSSSDGLDTYYAASNGYFGITKTQYSPFYIDVNDPDAKIFNLYEQEGILDYFLKMKDWGDKNYWSKSILSNKDDYMFRDGKSASRLHNQDSWRGAYMENPERDIQFFLNSSFTYKSAAMQDGMAIPASAKYPERALMFLEKLRTDQSYYNLFTYGIEGKHYEITDDDKLKALDMEAFAPEGYCSWGFKSLNFYKSPVGVPPNLEEVKTLLADRAIDNIFTLFTPNWEPVKNEQAAVNNVIQQYRLPMSYGYIEDVEGGLTTLVEKLKVAGSDKIMAEMQKQLDEYLAQ